VRWASFLSLLSLPLDAHLTTHLPNARREAAHPRADANLRLGALGKGVIVTARRGENKERAVTRWLLPPSNNHPSLWLEEANDHTFGHTAHPLSSHYRSRAVCLTLRTYRHSSSNRTDWSTAGGCLRHGGMGEKRNASDSNYRFLSVALAFLFPYVRLLSQLASARVIIPSFIQEIRLRREGIM